MEILTNVWFYIALLLGIALVGKTVYERLSQSLKKRKQLERARMIKDIRTEVRRYLEELQK